MYSSLTRLYIFVSFVLVCLLVCCFFVLFFYFFIYLECSTPFHGKIRAVHMRRMLNIVTARRTQK